MWKSDEKKHFKLYKSGRKWIVTGIAVTAFGFLGLNPVKADTSGTQSSDDNQITTNSSNFNSEKIVDAESTNNDLKKNDVESSTENIESLKETKVKDESVKENAEKKSINTNIPPKVASDDTLPTPSSDIDWDNWQKDGIYQDNFGTGTVANNNVNFSEVGFSSYTDGDTHSNLYFAGMKLVIKKKDQTTYNLQELGISDINQIKNIRLTRPDGTVRYLRINDGIQFVDDKDNWVTDFRKATGIRIYFGQKFASGNGYSLVSYVDSIGNSDGNQGIDISKGYSFSFDWNVHLQDGYSWDRILYGLAESAQVIKVLAEDADTKQILTDTTILGIGGREGDQLTSNAADLTAHGYYVTGSTTVINENGNLLIHNNDDNASQQITMSNNKTAVIYYYSNKASVNVKYIDQSGNSLSKDVLLSGVSGGDYQTKLLDFPGYKLIKVINDPNGTYALPSSINRAGVNPEVVYIYAVDYQTTISKPITSTIKYIDQESGNEISPNSTSVAVRFLTVKNPTTNKILTYYSTSTGLIKLNQTGVPMGDWHEGKTYTIDAVRSPNLNKLGYENPLITEVQEKNIDKNSSSIITFVTYAHAKIMVTAEQPGIPGTLISSDNPNGPLWPLGTSKVDLVKTVTRKINYLRQGTNQKVSKSILQTVTYHRIAIVDKVTGIILGYDINNDGVTDVTDETQSWISNICIWNSINSPNLIEVGYENPSILVIPSALASEDTVVNVYYVPNQKNHDEGLKTDKDNKLNLVKKRKTDWKSIKTQTFSTSNKTKNPKKDDKHSKGITSQVKEYLYVNLNLEQKAKSLKTLTDVSVSDVNFKNTPTIKTSPADIPGELEIRKNPLGSGNESTLLGEYLAGASGRILFGTHF